MWQLFRTAASFCSQNTKVLAGTKFQFSWKSPSSTIFLSPWRPRARFTRAYQHKKHHTANKIQVRCAYTCCVRVIESIMLFKPSLKPEINRTAADLIRMPLHRAWSHEISTVLVTWAQLRPKQSWNSQQTLRTTLVIILSTVPASTTWPGETNDTIIRS